MTDIGELIETATEKSSEVYYSLAERIATLSTGALALSITLKAKFVPSIPKSPRLLAWSWICFSVSIVSSVIVHWGRVVSHMDIVRQMLKNPSAPNYTGDPGFLYRLSMKVTFVSFVAAVCFLTYFAVINN
jgi:hypothetical protein